MSKKTRITNANILAEQRYLSKKFINEIDDLKRKLNDITVEKEQLQKKMTKQV